jgi:hypothetical protein
MRRGVHLLYSKVVVCTDLRFLGQVLPTIKQRLQNIIFLMELMREISGTILEGSRKIVDNMCVTKKKPVELSWDLSQEHFQIEIDN